MPLNSKNALCLEAEGDMGPFPRPSQEAKISAFPQRIERQGFGLPGRNQAALPQELLQVLQDFLIEHHCTLRLGHSPVTRFL